MIRVMLWHRGSLVRGALAAVLSRESDLEVVAEIDGADDVVAVAARARPDVIVLGPLVFGAVDVDELCRTVPAGGILVLVDRDTIRPTSLGLARRAPRIGLIGTDASPGQLVEAVRQIANGRAVLDAEIAVAALNARENPLTNREQEVLRLASTGATAQEIARSLSLSTGTVRNYLSHSLTKTGSRTRIEAVRVAHEAGWI